jgi:hypothetical protein
MDMKQVNIPQMHLESSRIHFNPTDLLYNFFGKNPKELKKLEMKKDDTVRNLLESKFDRETLAVLGIDKKKYPKYCNAVITLTLY